MNRRNFLQSMFWAPVLAVSAVAEAAVPSKVVEIDPVDVAIRDKRIVLGDGGRVERSDFMDSTIIVHGSHTVITNCYFESKPKPSFISYTWESLGRERD